jgi:hypothetical protein
MVALFEGDLARGRLGWLAGVLSVVAVVFFSLDSGQEYS